MNYSFIFDDLASTVRIEVLFWNFFFFHFTNAQKSNVSIEITDVTGKVVFAQDLGVKSPGQYNFDLEWSTFEAGMYFYSLNTNTSKVTKMMSVIK